jgi:hypothetical protein
MQRNGRLSLPRDAVEFVQTLFNFKPYEYQAKLLRDDKKRIVVRWSRQTGKNKIDATKAQANSIPVYSAMKKNVTPGKSSFRFLFCPFTLCFFPKHNYKIICEEAVENYELFDVSIHQADDG